MKVQTEKGKGEKGIFSLKTDKNSFWAKNQIFSRGGGGGRGKNGPQSVQI